MLQLLLDMSTFEGSLRLGGSNGLRVSLIVSLHAGPCALSRLSWASLWASSGPPSVAIRTPTKTALQESHSRQIVVSRELSDMFNSLCCGCYNSDHRTPLGFRARNIVITNRGLLCVFWYKVSVWYCRVCGLNLFEIGWSQQRHDLIIAPETLYLSVQEQFEGQEKAYSWHCLEC